MAPCPFLREDCPWKASALISAFTQLLISIILLLNSVVICLTFHVLRLCGLLGKNPSFCGSYANDGTRSPRKDAGGTRKRSRSRNARCTSCNAPKRPDILDVSDDVSDDDDDDGDDDDVDDDDDDVDAAAAGDLSSTRRSYAVEAVPCSDSSSSTCNKGNVVVSSASPGDAPFLDCKASHSKRISSILKTNRSFCKRNSSILGRCGAASDRSGSVSERNSSSVKNMDSSSERQASFLEKKGSFLKRKGPGLERSSSFCATSRSFCDRPKKEIASKASSTSGNDGIKDVEGSPREMVDDKSERQQSTEKNGTKKLCFRWENSRTCSGRMGSAASQQEIEGCFNDEISSSTMKENETGDELIRKLREALQVEREKLCDLYNELEHERIAAETAANETLTKILHLQEEKAALRMQAEHYQRMAEEKATYDEQAMLIMKDILYRKERENYLLEIEIDMIRRRLEGERERRMGPEAALVSASSDDDPVLLIKDVDEPKDSQGKSIQSCSRQEGQGDESDDSSTASSSIIERRRQNRGNNTASLSFRGDVHSYNRSKKRLKTAKFVQDVVLVDVQNQPRFVSVENQGKKLKHMTSYDNGCEVNKHSEEFNEETKSISAIISGDDARLAVEEASLDGQGKREELNPEGTHHLFGSLLPDTVVLAKRNNLSMNATNHAAKEMFWTEFNHYKAGNKSLYAQTSDTAPTSGKREDPSEEVVRSI